MFIERGLNMADYRKMWENLGLNMEAHDMLLQALPPTYYEAYLRSEERRVG